MFNDDDDETYNIDLDEIDPFVKQAAAGAPFMPLGSLRGAPPPPSLRGARDEDEDTYELGPADVGYRSPAAAPQGAAGSVNPSMALMQAGLGMLAASGQRDRRGLPMSGLGAIGVGGMQGLGMYQQQQAQAQKDQLAQQTLRMRERAHQQAQTFQQQRLAETERANRAREALTDQRIQTQTNRRTQTLPSPLIKDLEAKGTGYQQVQDFNKTFEDDYAGAGPAWVGDTKNYIARQFGVGNTDAASWWQNYQIQRNKVRHELFGSALTAQEIKQWNAQDINPGMDPSIIRKNLKRQSDIIEGAMKRRADSLIAQGYSQDAIEKQLGVKLDDLRDPIRESHEEDGGEEAAPTVTRRPPPSAEQKRALDWANSNPDDPRAARIKSLLRVR